MGKLLSWVLLAAVGYLAYRFLMIVKRKAELGASRRAEADGAAGEQAGRGEAMVQCARCGVHLPRSEALDRDGRSYCCAAHRDAG